MAIEAPISNFKKNNLKIYIVFLLALAAWCAYDGYFNTEWIEDHTDAEGNQETYLVFNRNAPAVLGGVAILLGVYLFMIKDKKVVADESGLTFAKKTISYDSIEKIDKTHFEKKGYFTITYKDQNGADTDCKLNDRTYDNLSAILDEVVAKIS